MTTVVTIARRALDALTQSVAYADAASRACRVARDTGDLSALEQMFAYAGPDRASPDLQAGDTKAAPRH